MKSLGILLLALLVAGCGEPAGSEGKGVDVSTLNRAQAAQTPKDDLKAPAPPSDGTPGGGR